MSILIQIIFDKYGKTLLSPEETYELTGRSVSMLQKDRTDGVGIEYLKMRDAKNAKVFYPIQAIVEYLENKRIKTL